MTYVIKPRPAYKPKPRQVFNTAYEDHAFMVAVRVRRLESFACNESWCLANYKLESLNYRYTKLGHGLVALFEWIHE